LENLVSTISDSKFENDGNILSNTGSKPAPSDFDPTKGLDGARGSIAPVVIAALSIGENADQDKRVLTLE
jgi:hypothetical protein